MNSEKNKHKLFLFLLISALIVFPGNAWAVQNHGAPEGLYVHQLAHIFYTAAMCYLFWGVRKSAFKAQGWRYLQVFCVLIILWNVLAFAGHILALHIHNSDFTHGASYLITRLQGPFTSVKFWYYFAQLDHLFSIPSFFFLYLAMKDIYHSSSEEEQI